MAVSQASRGQPVGDGYVIRMHPNHRELKLATACPGTAGSVP